MADRLLRLPDACKKVGYARSAFMKAVKEGKLPQPIKIGPRYSAYSEAELDAWIESQKAARTNKQFAGFPFQLDQPNAFGGKPLL